MKFNGIFAVMIMNAVSWTATAVVTVVSINITSNPFWSLLMLIPAFFGYSYKVKKE